MRKDSETETLISIVIPVYRAESSLRELYTRITASLTGFRYEIIFVDDHSLDNSWNIIGELSRADSRIKAYRHTFNMGQDQAILSGLKASKGSFAVIMDDDLQHRPEDIPVLFENCQNGADVCYGSFYIRKHTSWKLFGSYVNDLAARALLKKPAGLYLSPFKAINRKVIEQIIRYKGVFFYVDAVILSGQFSIRQVLLDHQPSMKLESSYTFIRSLNVFVNNLFCTASHNRLITAVLFLFFTVSIGLSGYVLNLIEIIPFRFETNHPVPVLLTFAFIFIFATILILFLFKNLKIYFYKNMS